jgi:tetratricopeptide (TPR) repeat protein
VESELTRKVEAWDDIIRWIVTLNAAYLPLLMSPITTDAFELPKATILYLSAIILLAAFLARSFHAGKLFFGRSPLDLPVLIFIATVTAGALTSPNPILSVTGQYANYENLPTIYSFALLYFMASRFINSSKHIKNLLAHAITAFGLVSLYGFLQHFGIDARQPFLRTPNKAIGSTLGNPVLLGGYAALMLPIVFSAIIDGNRELSTTKISKPVLIATFALGTAAIALTQAHGAWLGLMAGLLFVLIIRRRDLAGSSTMLGISIATAIVTTAIVLFLPAQAINAKSDTKTAISYPSETSISVRKELWKSAVLMVSVRPVSGYGVDQAYNWWPRFQTLRHAKLEIDTVPSRARNEFLQTAINNGIPGLLAFLWMLLAVAFILMRKDKADSDRKTISKETVYYAISGGLIAYFIQALFGIASIGVYSVIWVLLGATAPLGRTKPAPVFVLKPSIQQLSLVFMSLAVMLISVSIFKPFAADFYNFKGTVRRHSGDTINAAKEYSAAIQLNPNQSVYRKNLALIYYEKAKKAGNSRLSQQGMGIVDQGLRINPNDNTLMLTMAAGYRISALLAKENSLFDDAELYYGRVIEACPNFIAPRRAMLGMLLTKENYEKAIEQAQIILQIDPGDADVRYRLGLANEKIGKIGKARRIYIEVLKRNPNIADARIALMRIR